jgi:ribose transport system substrate-binding protein
MSKDGTSTFFDVSRKGAGLAAQDLSTASGREVTVRVMDPASSAGDAEVAQVEAAIAAKVQAIDIDVNDVAKVGPAIDKAVAAGITVMTFDSDASTSQRVTYYGIDNQKAGQTSAQLLTQLMGGTGGKIAIMVQENPPTSGNYIDRVKGFTDELMNHAGFDVSVTLPCTDKVEVAMQAGCTGVLEQAMKDYPDVTGWYLARGRILREAALATEAPNWTAKVKAGTFKAVSFDAIPASLDNIKAGYVNAVINQKYFGWGYDVVTLTYDIVTNGRKVPAFTDSQFDVICGNNIEQVGAMWTSLDFRTAIPKCSLLP